jgi:hypothetical protein
MTKAKLKFDNDLNLDNFLYRDNAKNKLIDLCNQRYDEIENLKEIVNQYASDPKRENLANEIIKLKTENLKLKRDNEITQSNLGESLNDNEKLESEIKDLKTHLRLIAKLSDYVSLGYKL